MKTDCAALHSCSGVVAFSVGLLVAISTVGQAAPIDLTATDARSSTATSSRIAPNPLLTVDQNRSTVVERVVGEWGDALANSGAGLTKEQLGTLLKGLRSDQLLAASLAGSLEGLRNVIANALTANAPVARSLFQTKVLGDSTDDLVYTPVTPCRILDSRFASGGVLQSGQTRNWLAANPSGNFVAQGGAASNCGIPIKPAAVLLNLTVANTTGAANFLTVWPFGVTRPNASTLNWTAPGQQIANAVIIPLCVGGGCTDDFSTYASSQTDLIGDVLGYFAAPGGANPVPIDSYFNITVTGSAGIYGTVWMYCINASCSIPVPNTYGFGSSSGTVAVTRNGVGNYTVTFPWIPVGVPQVTAYDGNSSTSCKVAFWGSNPVAVTVNCYELLL